MMDSIAVSDTNAGPGIPFGEYVLLKRLGAGGMAEVFLAKRKGPGGFEKKLVIKRILPHLSASASFTELFMNEAKFAALIDHPNVVHVSGFGETEGTLYLAMEYIQGVTIADLLKFLGSVSPGMGARIGIGVLEGLFAIHTIKDDARRPIGLVHRDVGARNVMVTPAGGVKLLDFGIAIARTDSGGSNPVSMGTRGYMAPEQSTGGPVDARADLFSVGALLWELVSGSLPPESRPLVRPPEMPDSLFEILSRMLAIDPQDRPSSAREVARSLELFANERGLEATAATLGDTVDGLAPAESAMNRPKTRLTRLTRWTTGRTQEETSEEVRSAVHPAVLGAAAIFLAGGAWMLWGSKPATVEAPVASAPVTRTSSTPMAVLPIVTSSTLTTTAPDPSPRIDAETDRRDRRLEKRKPTKPAKAKTGQLTIDTRPWTEVYVGTRKLGITPLSGVELPAGEVEIQLRNSAMGIDQAMTVKIRSGEVTRINRTL